MRILTILEATEVNAVAKNVLDFHRWVNQLNDQTPGAAPIVLSAVTFERIGKRTRPTHGFVETAKAEGLPVDVIRERWAFDPRVIPTMRAITNRCRPDVIATHNVKSHFLARLSGIARTRPWLAFHHGYTTPDLKMRMYNQLDRWSLAGADQVLAVCRPFAEQALQTGLTPERVIVQHNAIDRREIPTAAAIHEVRSRWGVGPQESLLLAIGRLSSEKGHLDLIDAYAEFRKLRPRVVSKLLILGEGPERAKLQARIEREQLAEQVFLAGHIQDVQPYYGAAGLFLLPSHSEGSPYVLLEAMAAGVPVVATAVGGIPEIATHEDTALLVPPRNPAALAAAITRMTDHPDWAKTLSVNALKQVSERFSPAAYVHSLLRIYTSLAAKRQA